MLTTRVSSRDAPENASGVGMARSQRAPLAAADDNALCDVTEQVSELEAKIAALQGHADLG